MFTRFYTVLHALVNCRLRDRIYPTRGSPSPTNADLSRAKPFKTQGILIRTAGSGAPVHTVTHTPPPQTIRPACTASTSHLRREAIALRSWGSLQDQADRICFYVVLTYAVLPLLVAAWRMMCMLARRCNARSPM